MSRANILAQIANPQGGENVMRAYQQGTQMRYMQDERDRMQRQENALFQMAPMIESGDWRGAAAAATRGGQPHLVPGFITVAQKQERDQAFTDFLNPGGGGAGGVPPVSGGEPMPIVRPSMGAGSDAGSAAPQGRFTPQQIAESTARWSLGDEPGAMDALYPKSQLTDDEREFSRAQRDGYGGTFMEYLTSMKKAGATSVNVGTEGERRGAVMYTSAKRGYDYAMANFEALSDTKSQIGGVVEDYIGPAGRSMQTPEYQVALDGVADVMWMHAYSTTGAQMSVQEARAKAKQMMPAIGDTPQRTAEKKARLTSYMEAIEMAAGRALPQAQEHTQDAQPDEEGWMPGPNGTRIRQVR